MDQMSRRAFIRVFLSSLAGAALVSCARASERKGPMPTVGPARGPAPTPEATPLPTISTMPGPTFGAPTNLAELPPEVGLNYRISPDGRWMCYWAFVPAADGSAMLRVTAQSLESGNSLTLWEGRPEEARCAWFPDSQHVLLACGGWPAELLVKSLGPEPARSLFQSGKGELGFAEAVPSPDGQHVALAVFYDAGPAPVPKVGIDIIDVDGADRRQIVEPDFFIGRLAWSPDAVQIVYFRGKGGTPPEDGEAYSVGLEEGAWPRQLLPRARLVVWSPDGRNTLWLAEPADAEGNGDLMTSDWPDLAAVRVLARGVHTDGATWIGDGSWVAYARSGSLELVAASGDSQALLLVPAEEQASAPVWLPGRGLAYRSEKGGVVRLKLLPLASG